MEVILIEKASGREIARCRDDNLAYTLAECVVERKTYSMLDGGSERIYRVLGVHIQGLVAHALIRWVETIYDE